jgi:hypothetical protein
MAASMTSAAVRIRATLVALAAASVVGGVLLATPVQAAAPGARTSAMTSLEEALIVTPDLEPAEARQPVVGYLRRTDEGWALDMLPGAVGRNGPLPVLTNASDSALEDMTSHSLAPNAPLIRVDF